MAMASSPVKAKSDNLLGLSTSEARVLILGITSQKDGKVDYEKVAQKGGWKNASSASTTYRNAYRKLQNIDSDESTASASTDAPVNNTATITPRKTPTKRKKIISTAGGEAALDNGQDGDAPTKPKRQRKSPTKGRTDKGKKANDVPGPETVQGEEEDCGLEDINSVADFPKFSETSPSEAGVLKYEVIRDPTKYLLQYSTRKQRALMKRIHFHPYYSNVHRGQVNKAACKYL